jgi:hypothetical protein
MYFFTPHGTYPPPPPHPNSLYEAQFSKGIFDEKNLSDRCAYNSPGPKEPPWRIGYLLPFNACKRPGLR